MATSINLGVPWMLGNPTTDHPAERLRQVLAGLFRHSSGGNLKVDEGLLPGVVNVTDGSFQLLSSTQLRVRPFTCVVQGNQSTDQGAYLVPSPWSRDLDISPRDGSLYRRSLVVVEVLDSEALGVPADATNDFAQLRIIPGALSSSVTPPLPAPPADAVSLGEVLIPPTSASGKAVTFTHYRPAASLAGAIAVSEATTLTPARHRGQYRDHPTRGLQRVNQDMDWEVVTPRARYLGGDSGQDGETTTNRAIVTHQITVPADLNPNSRIRYTGVAHLVTGANVRPVLGFHGGRGERYISRGTIESDFTVIYYDPDLTPGTRTIQLRVRPATNDGDKTIEWRAARIWAEVV